MLYVDDYLQFHPHCGERWVSGAHTLLCFSVHHIQAPKPPLNEPLKKGKYKIMTVHHLVNKLELLTEHNNMNMIHTCSVFELFLKNILRIFRLELDFRH